MAYVGYTGVANLANTGDGFASHTSAANVVGAVAGDAVGATSVVDQYGAVANVKSYVLMENAGYVLQETGEKIVLETS